MPLIDRTPKHSLAAVARKVTTGYLAPGHQEFLQQVLETQDGVFIAHNETFTPATIWLCEVLNRLAEVYGYALVGQLMGSKRSLQRLIDGVECLVSQMPSSMVEAAEAKIPRRDVYMTIAAQLRISIDEIDC